MVGEEVGFSTELEFQGFSCSSFSIYPQLITMHHPLGDKACHLAWRNAALGETSPGRGGKLIQVCAVIST